MLRWELSILAYGLGSAIRLLCDLELITFLLWASLSSSVQHKDWVIRSAFLISENGFSGSENL